MPLHTHFDHLYLLNLDRRNDRLLSAYQQFAIHGIKGVERFSAIDGREVKHLYNTPLNAGELGIILSNIEILKDAKSKGYKTIAIIEDDISFNSKELANIDDYFSALPKDWHTLALSQNHNSHVLGVDHPQLINDKVVRTHTSYAAHFMGIKESMYDVVIKLIGELNKPIDVYYAQLSQQYPCYCFVPESGEAIATQIPSFSDTTMKEENYSWLIK